MKKILLAIILFAETSSGQSWSNLTTGTNEDVWAFCEHNGQLYMGGAFFYAGNLLCNKIASWDGNTWDTLPNVPGGDNISAIESYNGSLYMSRASFPGLWKFDGTTWTVPDNGLSAVAVDMIEFNNDLFVGGFFTTAGTVAANYVARWNDTTWQTAGAGFDSHVLCFAIFNNELFAGGRFSGSGAVPASKIAKWTGSQWLPVGSGLANDVHSMEVYNGELYAASTAGLHKWNGSVWSTVVPVLISDMATHNSELYVGGFFGMIQGAAANNIASWNGSTWNALGNGVNGGYVNSLAIYNNELYAGGNFDSAGTLAANNIARWALSQNIEEIVGSLAFVYPNPVDNYLNVEVHSENVYCRITDMQGRVVLINKLEQGTNQLSVFQLHSGLYALILENEKQILYSQKISIK